ncbi:phytoene/squalene synthase family protein [Nocardia sp. NBC_00565]|uniref:phytoene/squalene synthase family protein n=1 Tax=Nocardia sp. NBC_00565 TaxID=2975993 RepID=UPI002E80C51F|nr:phytoene/squalene synthase family protein [Nocardia sp. NBC_00565]WUC04363.1 phytoene/squalene synthase family protein [Nocardia sp. NBC_00565]
MTEVESAAGIAPDAELAAAYRVCREIAAAHGRTYFLATRLLYAPRRPAVHALYAFARIVDDIVDHPTLDAEHGPAGELDMVEKQLRVVLEQGVPAASGPAERTRVLIALADTIHRYDIAPQHFWTFLDSMRMDVPGTAHFHARYTTMTELRAYMRGSAAAIGLQLLPVLGTVVPVVEAEPAAAALGEAFQLTNFLRDIAEDLDRGRIYLPADELAAFGVDADLLAHCRRTGQTDHRVRRALAHLIAINRDLYRVADPGIDLLDPRVRPAIRTAGTLYSGILERIEDFDYAVFARRAVVPQHRRLRVAAAEFTTAALRRS